MQQKSLGTNGYWNWVFVVNSNRWVRAATFWLGVILLFSLFPSTIDAPRGGLALLMIILFWPLFFLEMSIRYAMQKASAKASEDDNR